MEQIFVKKQCIDKYFDKKNRLWTVITFCHRTYMIPLQYLSDWHICLRNILEEKSQIEWLKVTLKFFGYFSAPQCFGFFCTSAAKATYLQELTGCFRPRLWPDTQNRAFAKNSSCTQILDTTLALSQKKLHWKYTLSILKVCFICTLDPLTPIEVCFKRTS